MKLIKCAPMLLLLFCAACSSNVMDEAETVRLDYWEREESTGMYREEYIDETNGLGIFEDAANSAEKLKNQNVIATKPLLSLEFMTESEERRSYHLWVTEGGEGYLQSLAPQKNRTYQLKPNSTEKLTEFFSTKENVEILQGDIEFEQR